MPAVNEDGIRRRLDFPVASDSGRANCPISISLPSKVGLVLTSRSTVKLPLMAAPLLVRTTGSFNLVGCPATGRGRKGENLSRLTITGPFALDATATSNVAALLTFCEFVTVTVTVSVPVLAKVWLSAARFPAADVVNVVLAVESPQLTWT